jgi:hypothetical protein
MTIRQKNSNGLNPHFSPGSVILGQAGKAGWMIGRRGIVILRLKADHSRCAASLFQNPDRTEVHTSTSVNEATILNYKQFPVEQVRLVRNAG